ncbi:MAG: hypothetical protein OEW73_01355 [Gammaproteobacteria bacterium]|nr:hypothetical protein [Gammaproteobacteria bacterium]MDH5260506.1 hypothetical protein [Gammaproteobacteria bacterium]MDH5583821.1 hypothetical protein [Gammaproteobacteria bacterium]
MKNGSSRNFRVRQSLPAIFAVGSSLAAFPAAALELGDLTVHSRLGQPLRASIAYALAPTEQIDDYCVKMRPGPSVSGLPGFGDATISVANGVIMLTGNTPVREPMISAHVVINCPYSANLSREYLLFIDPLTSPYEQATVMQQVETVAEPVAQAVAATPVAVSRPATVTTALPVQKDISEGTRYQVQRGDSLSEIAQRIENRPVGLWPAANAIFSANPDAFLNNDPNQLKAGSWLSIPDFNGIAATIAPAQTVAVPVDEPVTDIAAASIADVIDAAYVSAEPYEPDAIVGVAPVQVILDDLVDTSESKAELKPGDIILDAQIEGSTPTSTSSSVPTAIISTSTPPGNRDASLSWFAWLVGVGIALIFGLAMFGRRLRQKPDTAPDAAMETNRRRFSDTETNDTQNIEAVDVDYDISDESPTHENLILDADLVIGSGLSIGSDSDISQDFGFAATTELDIELPFEPEASAIDQTDMLPPLRTDEHSILDSEILPDDDDYDMSVIVDATKVPRPEEITKRDLKAVKLDLDDDSMIAPNYTINKQADYQVLEQDYEDEMTATQALNEEIARVANELAARLEEDADDNVTTAMPLATVTELDITAQMPAQNDDLSDLDDTGINEAITVNTAAEEETVEMPYEAKKAR